VAGVDENAANAEEAEAEAAEPNASQR